MASSSSSLKEKKKTFKLETKTKNRGGGRGSKMPRYDENMHLHNSLLHKKQQLYHNLSMTAQLTHCQRKVKTEIWHLGVRKSEAYTQCIPFIHNTFHIDTIFALFFFSSHNLCTSNNQHHTTKAFYEWINTKN